jgi:glycosyltransferase involved in cell wall biosynthesis
MIENKIHVGIDATNLRQGGGITHIVEILRNFDIQDSPIQQVTIWCDASLAKYFPRKKWIVVQSNALIDGNRIVRFFWQQLLMSKAMLAKGCDIGFFPGGIVPMINRIPAVTMSQNMLPFDLSHAYLFGAFNLMFWKLFILRWLQIISFRRANGLIFLSQYAKFKVNKLIDIDHQVLIPHGVDNRFFKPPAMQKNINQYSFERPYEFIYVSILMPYKHQIEVAKAICFLRNEGFPVACKFIGPSWGWYGKKFKKEIVSLNPEGNFLHYLGEIDYEKLESSYHEADAFIFASSCENLPNILIEAMSSGLPVACSYHDPMPEVLGDAGFYFNPSNPISIYEAMKAMILSPNERTNRTRSASDKSLKYSWNVCSEKTFAFIVSTLRR